MASRGSFDIDALTQLKTSSSVQQLIGCVVPHLEPLTANCTGQVHMLIIGLGPFCERYAPSRDQLALFECLTDIIEQTGVKACKYVVDPAFTSADISLLKGIGYTILEPRDSYTIPEILPMGASNRVMCYLPNVPITLLLPIFVSLPDKSMCICTCLKRLVDQGLLSEKDSKLNTIASDIAKFWDDSRLGGWLKQPVARLNMHSKRITPADMSLGYGGTVLYLVRHETDE